MNTGFLDPAVATVPTACGIETSTFVDWLCDQSIKVATVPTACGIETNNSALSKKFLMVATVPTACGIETQCMRGLISCS